MQHIIFRLLLLGIIIGAVLWFAGCTEETKSPTAPTQNTPATRTIDPKCIITGKILNRCTGEAISGAVISVGYDGVQSVTSDASGSFSFSNVPASQFKICTTCTVKTGTFLLTATLTDPKYKKFSYDTVVTTFTALDSVAVIGLAADVVFLLNPLTTLSGTVVDESLVPVANANITINNHYVGAEILRSKTDASGGFAIAGVETGVDIEIRAKSADGSLEGMVFPYIITCNIPTDSARVQVMHEQIVLRPVDDMRPYVASLTPADSADVSTSVQFVYTFSEPIQQNSYTVTTLGVGHGTIIDDISITFNGLKKTTAALPTPNIQWNAPTYTTLTITPNGLAGSSKYTLNAATAIMKLKDRVGNFMQPNPFKTIKGDNEALNFTTAGGTAPLGAPILSRRTIPGVLGAINYNGGVVGLQWTPVVGARSYNLYRKIDGGPFEILHKDITSLMDTNNITSLCLPSSSLNPLSAISVQYYVTTVNADLLESTTASNLITISDEVKPRLDTVVVSGGGILPNSWRYSLRFFEPLNKANAETIGNYAIPNPDSVTFAITDADYLGYDAILSRYIVQLVITSNLAPPAGYSLRASTGVTDLAGNSMDTTRYAIAFSAPRIPTLSSPPNQLAPAIGLPAILTWQIANGAASYRLQVSTVNGAGFNTGIVFNSDNLSSLITGTSYGVTTAYLTPGVTYYWRVAGINTAGVSTYSAIWQFVP